MTPAIKAQIESAISAGAPARPPSNWRNDGKQFEREIEMTAGAYQSRRIATLRKVDPPVRVFMRPDRNNPGRMVQQVVFLSNPHLDYVGAWTQRHARALMIELKSKSTRRLPFNTDSGGGLRPEQWAAMKTWRLCGAACCLLWRFGDRVRLWTPDMLLGAEGRGDKSIVFDSGHEVPRGAGSVVWDFLPVLERAIWPGADK